MNLKKQKNKNENNLKIILLNFKKMKCFNILKNYKNY